MSQKNIVISYKNGSKKSGSGGDEEPNENQVLLSPDVKFKSPSVNGNIGIRSNGDISEFTPLDILDVSKGGDTGTPPPVDRYNLVFMIFVLHGIGVLMPWNMFITAHDYFVGYKLNIHTGVNETDVQISGYRTDFLSYVGVAAQIPNVLCNAANLFMHTTTGSITVRVTISILTESVIFITTVILALVDSSGWPVIFFYVTIFTVILLNMANGIYQNCVYGIAANLPMKYSGAVVFGTNISGVLTSIISITSIGIAASAKTAAVYYFLTALFVLFLCLDTYFLLPLCKFFRYHQTVVERTSSSSSPSKPSKSTRGKYPNYLKIFKEIWPQCLNVFCIFFVTLSIFPAVHAKVSTTGSLAFLTKKYFSQVTCFLTFNVTAMIGNLIPSWFIYPSPDKLWIPVFLRVLLIPFFMLCNYSPETRVWPVFFESDLIYLTGGMILGLSSGYLSSLAMMYAPKCVSDPETAPTAGMMAAFFLILGISTGIFFSFFLSSLIEYPFF